MASPAPPTDDCETQLSLPALADENLEEIFLLLSVPEALARASFLLLLVRRHSPAPPSSSYPARRRSPLEFEEIAASLPRPDLRRCALDVTHRSSSGFKSPKRPDSSLMSSPPLASPAFPYVEWRSPALARARRHSWPARRHSWPARRHTHEAGSAAARRLGRKLAFVSFNLEHAAEGLPRSPQDETAQRSPLPFRASIESRSTDGLSCSIGVVVVEAVDRLRSSLAYPILVELDQRQDSYLRRTKAHAEFAPNIVRLDELCCIY